MNHMATPEDFRNPTGPTTKPKQRVLLRACIDALREDDHVNERHAEVLDHLEAIHRELRNRWSPPAPSTCVPVTPTLARRVRAFHARHSNWTYHDIAVRFNVQIGRISEILRGKRV
jgi:hypothetical protein